MQPSSAAWILVLELVQCQEKGIMTSGINVMVPEIEVKKVCTAVEVVSSTISLRLVVCREIKFMEVIMILDVYS